MRHGLLEDDNIIEVVFLMVTKDANQLTVRQMLRKIEIMDEEQNGHRSLGLRMA